MKKKSILKKFCLIMTIISVLSAFPQAINNCNPCNETNPVIDNYICSITPLPQNTQYNTSL